MFIAEFAIKRLAVVKTQMGSKAIPRVKGLLTTGFRTLERLLFGVDAYVDL